MNSWKPFWLALALAFSTASLAACGDGDTEDDVVDFIDDQDDDENTSPIGVCDPADCPSGTVSAANGCAYDGSATTVTVSGTVVDFQSERAMAEAVVYLMDNDTGEPTGVCQISDGSGNVSMDVPAAMKLGFGTHIDGAKDTYQFNQEYAADTDEEDFFSVSEVTAQLIPGIIGTTPDETKGTIAGTVYNSSGSAITDSTATYKVRTKSGQDAYYFTDGGLPTDRTDQPELNTNEDGSGTGLFTVFDVPVGAVELELTYNGDVSATTDSKLFAFEDSVSISNITCVECK